MNQTRYKIRININAQHGVLILTDAPLSDIEEVFTKGGVLNYCTREFIAHTSFVNTPTQELNTSIFIPKTLVDNCIVEIDEVPALEVNPEAEEMANAEIAAEKAAVNGKPSLTKA